MKLPFLLADGRRRASSLLTEQSVNWQQSSPRPSIQRLLCRSFYCSAGQETGCCLACWRFCPADGTSRSTKWKGLCSCALKRFKTGCLRTGLTSPFQRQYAYTYTSTSEFSQKWISFWERPMLKQKPNVKGRVQKETAIVRIGNYHQFKNK